jgi:hypothetical protein
MNRKLQARLQVAFCGLNRSSAREAFPPSRALTEDLNGRIPGDGFGDVQVPARTAELFATASVDIWRRAVHSFLISASLTKASPIWAAVCGYYSSHYSVRAFAHLLGFFLLFSERRVVRWDFHGGVHICSFQKKGGQDREHKLYWNRVKEDEHFETDPIFTRYDPGRDISDVLNRDRANYSDHLSAFYPPFQSLSRDQLKERVGFISKIEFQDPPIPDINRFIDLESVQIVAYHRMVKYRQFLDEILGDTSRFWNVHRNPSFASGMINFQLVENRGISGLHRT